MQGALQEFNFEACMKTDLYFYFLLSKKQNLEVRNSRIKQKTWPLKSGIDFVFTEAASERQVKCNCYSIRF